MPCGVLGVSEVPDVIHRVANHAANMQLSTSRGYCCAMFVLGICQPVATRVCLSLVTRLVAALFFCHRRKRKVFLSCSPPIRRSLVLRHPPPPPSRRSRPLPERCCTAPWDPTPPHPPAASSLNPFLLLLSPRLLRHPALPPQPRSSPIGRAAPSTGACPSLLLLASRAPLSSLSNTTHGPSYAKGTLTDLLHSPVCERLHHRYRGLQVVIVAARISH